MGERDALATLPDGYKRDFEQKTSKSLISEMVPVGRKRQQLDRDGHGSGVLRAQDNAGAVQSPDGKGAGGRVSGKRDAAGSGKTIETAIPPWCGCRIVRSTKPPASPRSPGRRRLQETTTSTLVHVAFKAWPSKEMIAQWMHYLKDVRVCDTRLPGAAVRDPCGRRARAGCRAPVPRSGCACRRDAVARRGRCCRARSRRRGTRPTGSPGARPGIQARRQLHHRRRRRRDPGGILRR